MAEKLLTVRETAEILGVSEKQVIDLVNEGKIPAYKIAGEFLRFQKDQIEKLKNNYQTSQLPEESYSLKEKIADFLYFYDFYIISILIIFSLLLLVFYRL